MGGWVARCVSLGGLFIGLVGCLVVEGLYMQCCLNIVCRMTTAKLWLNASAVDGCFIPFFICVGTVGRELGDRESEGTKLAEPRHCQRPGWYKVMTGEVIVPCSRPVETDSKHTRDYPKNAV